MARPHSKNAYLTSREGEGEGGAKGAATSYAQELKDKVQVWSDYSATFYHPKSILELPAYTHGEEEERAFASYNQGAAVWHGASGTPGLAEEVVEERIRFFLEEADNPQGFQVLTDMDGFAGLAVAAVEALAEEFPKKAILTLSLHEQQSRMADINGSLALAGLSENSSSYIPIHSTRHLPPTGEWASMFHGHPVWEGGSR